MVLVKSEYLGQDSDGQGPGRATRGAVAVVLRGRVSHEVTAPTASGGGLAHHPEELGGHNSLEKATLPAAESLESLLLNV